MANAEMSWLDSLLINTDIEKLTLKEKLGAYHMITEGYAPIDMKNTYIYGMKGLELAKRANDKRMISTFYRYIGSTYTYRASYDTAHIYQQMQIDIAEETQDRTLLLQGYFGLGNIYARQGKFQLAVESYLKCISFYNGDSSQGIDIPTVLRNLERSFEFYSPLRTYLMCLGNAGECYRRLKNPDRALIYLTEALEVMKANGIELYTNIQLSRELGYAYFAKGEMDKALEYLSIQLDKGYPMNQVHESDCKEALIKVYIVKGEYDKALEYAHDCLRLAASLGDPYIDVLAWNSFAEIYRAQGRYRECESAAMNAWNIDSVSVDTAPVSATNIAYANLHLGNPEKAEYFFRKGEYFTEQKSNKNFQEGMADMEVRYDTEKKEMRISTLEKENQLYVSLGASGLLLAVSLGVVLRQKVKNAQREKQLIATRSMLQGEMNERSRLARDLHDRLSGNLAAVKISLKDKKESLFQVYDKLDGCIEEIRRVSYNLMPISLQFGMKVALGDFAAQFPNVSFHFFGQEKRIEDRTEFIVYCCANELVNNSLRHSGAKHIHLQLIQDEEYISLTVQDDGCGFDEKNIIKGFGIKNIHDRVISCNGKIDMQTSPGKGTETTIELKTGKT